MPENRSHEPCAKSAPRVMFALDRPGAGHLYSLDGRAGECMVEVEHVSARELVALRSVIRRSNLQTVQVRTSNDLVATLAEQEIETFFTGLIAGKTNTLARFLRWELDVVEAARHAPRLVQIAALFHVADKSEPELFRQTVEARFGRIRYALFATHVGDGEFTVMDTSPMLRDGNTNWFTSARGAHLSTFPDGAYADWCIACYHNVLAQTRPEIEQVTIDLHMGGRRRYRQDYARLMLPFANEITGLEYVLNFMTDLNLHR